MGIIIRNYKGEEEYQVNEQTDCLKCGASCITIVRNKNGKRYKSCSKCGEIEKIEE